MSRELRRSPPASSAIAARVRVASAKPKAARRSATASGDRRGPAASGRAANASSSGRKKRRSWMVRTWVWHRRSASSKRRVAVRDRVVLVPEHPGQALVGDGVGRHRVGLLLLDELDPVLDRAQEAVGVGQGHGVVVVDVAGRAQARQRAERGAVADLGVVAAVDELQELHRELHVADPAGGPLELAPGRGPGRGHGASLRAFMARTSASSSA